MSLFVPCPEPDPKIAAALGAAIGRLLAGEPGAAVGEAIGQLVDTATSLPDIIVTGRTK